MKAQDGDGWPPSGVPGSGLVPSLGWRDVLAYGCGFGSAVTLLFWAMLLSAVHDWDAGMVRRALLPVVPAAMGDGAGLAPDKAHALISPVSAFAPWLIATASVAMVAVYGRVLRARSFAMAVAAGTGIMALAAIMIAGLFALGGRMPAVGLGWMLVVAVATAVLAVVMGRRRF